MSKVAEFRERIARIVPTLKERAANDGHCTFGYEFRYEEDNPVFFVTLDLAGSYFWTGSTMDDALRKAGEFLDKEFKVA